MGKICSVSEQKAAGFLSRLPEETSRIVKDVNRVKSDANDNTRKGQARAQKGNSFIHFESTACIDVHQRVKIYSVFLCG